MENQNSTGINKSSIKVKPSNDNYIKSLGFDMYEIQFELTNGNTIKLRGFCKKNTPELSESSFFSKNMINEIFANYLELRNDINSIILNGYFYYGNNGLDDFNRVLNKILNYTNISNKIINNADRGTTTISIDKTRRNTLPPSKFGTGYTRFGDNSSNAEQTSRQTSTNITGTGGINQGSLQRNGNIWNQESIGEAGNSIKLSNPTKQHVNKLPESPFYKGYIRYESSPIIHGGVGASNGKRASNGNGENPNFKTTARTPGNIVGKNNHNPRNAFSTGMKFQTRPLLSKTYCLSDMHGEKNAYDEAMKQILPKDRVYILGDAIDRGEHGLDILLDIIKRQEAHSKDSEHNPQITFLLGNHEVGLLDLIRIKKEFNLSMQDIATLKKYDRINCDMFFWNLNKTLYKKQIEDAIRKMKDGDIENKVNSIMEKMKVGICNNLVRSGEKGKNVEDELKEYMKRISAYRENGTIDTLEKLAELDSQKQNQILNFLYDSNIAVSVEEKGKKYLMIHAAPLWDDNQNQPQQNNVWNQLKKNGKIEYKKTGINDTWNMVGQRDLAQKGYDFANKKGYYMTICGHTPSDDGEIERGTNYIRIDGGCGHKDRKNPNLVLYNLTDDKEIYIPPYSIIKGQAKGGN